MREKYWSLSEKVRLISQANRAYVKNNITKHISPKFFFPHELQKQGEVSILQIRSCDNLADLFTKFLRASTFTKCV